MNRLRTYNQLIIGVSITIFLAFYMSWAFYILNSFTPMAEYIKTFILLSVTTLPLTIFLIAGLAEFIVGLIMGNNYPKIDF